MRWHYIIRSLGILLTTFSVSLMPPIAVAIWYHEPTVIIFLISALVAITLGVLLWYPFRHTNKEPFEKDGFLIVALFWIALCLVGSLPFILTKAPEISLVDSIFESVSGLTATGASVLTGLDFLPRSILYYRQQLQFLGGMGVILLAIAILPTLGIGGMQLVRAEISGPAKDTKLTPRIAHTAKAIWMIYVSLIFSCTIAYWAAGMELFDAIGYSFGTVSTGGYTTHDQGISYYQDPIIQLIASFFMFLGAINFSLHFITLRHASLKHYWRDLEFKSFSILILVTTAIVSLLLHKFHLFDNFSQTLVASLFHVVSSCTTTGFSTDHTQWPLFAPILLLLLGLIGGCAGSTSGGIKIVRLLLLHKQGIREIKRLIHPNAHYVIKFDKYPLSDRVINAIWGFLATYIALFGVFLILLQATGLDFITAYSAVAACLSNVGPGLGSVAENYQNINDPAKILLSLAMLIGRLELFTILVLLTPTYWRS